MEPKPAATESLLPCTELPETPAPRHSTMAPLIWLVIVAVASSGVWLTLSVLYSSGLHSLLLDYRNDTAHRLALWIWLPLLGIAVLCRVLWLGVSNVLHFSSALIAK